MDVLSMKASKKNSNHFFCFICFFVDFFKEILETNVYYKNEMPFSL